MDDDPGRIDVDAVYEYPSRDSYWARGRPREAVERSVCEAGRRVVGLYDEDHQVGFARVLSDGIHVAHLCDVYVLKGYRGQGLGEEVVREAVDNGPRHRCSNWTLATEDAHGLYQALLDLRLPTTD